MGVHDVIGQAHASFVANEKWRQVKNMNKKEILSDILMKNHSNEPRRF